MQDTDNHAKSEESKAVFVSDVDMARLLGVSPQFLQKDRVGPQRIPFVRLGDRCLYEPHVVLEAVRAMAVGGNQPSRARMARRRRGTIGGSIDR